MATRFISCIVPLLLCALLETSVCTSDVLQMFPEFKELQRSVKAMKDDNAGKNRPAFTVVLSGSSAKLGGYGHTLKFNHAILDRGNVYDINTGKFTAPVSGLYQLSITIMARSDKAINLGLYHNNHNIMSLYGPPIHGTSETANPVLELTKGDTIDIRNPISVKQMVNGDGYSYMSGFYIGK